MERERVVIDCLRVPLFAASVTVTNIPSAVTEVAGTYRIRVNLLGLTSFRIGARVAVAAAAGGVLRLQYSLDDANYVNLGSQTIPLSTTGTKVTTWEAIPKAAIADVFLRVVTSGGNAADDPQLRGVWLQAS